MIMNEKSILEKLDSLYEDKKSQKFIDHLVKSYIPKGKLENVIEVPKGRFRCAITNLQLVAIENIFDEIGEDIEKKNQFVDYMGSDYDLTKLPKLEILNHKSIPVTGKNTDTFLCVESYRALVKWIQKKISIGDKHVYWLIKEMQAEREFDVKRGK